MASCGNPTTEQDALMTPRLKFDKSKDCVRCKEQPGNIVIRHAVYCKTCFFPLIAQRFRKSLEPSINPIPDGPRKKAPRAAGNVLLGFSGGLGSTVLLDLVVRSYFSETQGPGGKPRGGTAHPRNGESVWREGGVAYVEVCGAFPGMRDRTEEVRREVERCTEGRLEFVPLRLEDAFDEAWWESVGGRPTEKLAMDMGNEDLFLSHFSSQTPDTTPTSALQTFISALPTQTAVPTAVQTLVRLLLLHTAAHRGCSHLLLGTGLTTLSVALIAGIAQGGGFAVREEAQEEWKVPEGVRVDEGEKSGKSGKERVGRIRVIRPLRDVGMKECAVWAWWSGLRVVGRERYFGGRQGVGALTRDFIVGLERDYPSTVSTIARTCAKLAPKEGSEGVCMLCERPAQPGVQAWKSRISIRSYADSPHARPPHLPALSSPNCTPSPSPPQPALTPHLCYSCHTTLTSRSSRGVAGGTGARADIPVPVWVAAAISRGAGVGEERREGDGEQQEGEEEVWRTRRMRESEMRERIGEFLLDD